MKLGKDCIGVSVFALVYNKKGEVLLAVHKLTEKKGKDYDGVWAMPGGTVEFGEQAKDALKREIKEETNIRIKDIELLSYNDYILENEGKHWLALNFRAKAINSNAKNCEPEKFKEIAFVDPKKLNNNFSKFCREALTRERLI